MVVYPRDTYKMSRLLTGKKGQQKKRNSVRRNDNQFWIWPDQGRSQSFQNEGAARGAES